MRRAILVLATASRLGFAATAAIAQSETVGSVSQLKGTASGEIGETIETLDLGTSVFMDEVLATGAASRLAVSLLDETQLTLGERAKVRVDRFVYGGGHTQMLKIAAVGALRFISGGSKPAGTRS